jgi:hypothetical protein
MRRQNILDQNSEEICRTFLPGRTIGVYILKGITHFPWKPRQVQMTDEAIQLHFLTLLNGLAQQCSLVLTTLTAGHLGRPEITYAHVCKKVW